MVKKVLIIILVVVLIFLVGLVAFLMINRQSGTAGENAIPKPGPTFSLGEFTVNLADNTFIRTTIVLELDGKTAEKQLNERQPQIKHSIIATLRLVKSSELDQDNGVEYLSLKIKESINDMLNSSGVRNVYFTQLVVQ